MKADLAMVTMRPTEQELKLVEPIIQANCVEGVEPNIVINVYKNRGGTYGQVRIFALQNLGNMKFTDLFVTDWNYKQIDPSVLPKLHLKSPELRQAQKQQLVTEEEMYKPELVQEEEEGLSVEIEDGVYVVTGKALRRIMYCVNFDDMESVQFFQKSMESQGVFDKLREMGIEDGDTVKIYDIEFEFYN